MIIYIEANRDVNKAKYAQYEREFKLEDKREGQLGQNNSKELSSGEIGPTVRKSRTTRAQVHQQMIFGAKSTVHDPRDDDDLESIQYENNNDPRKYIKNQDRINR